MNHLKRTRLIKRKEHIEEMLELYYELQKEIIKNPVQSYTIGSRSLTRYGFTPASLMDAIESLEEELAEIESELASGSRRASRSVVLRDW